MTALQQAVAAVLDEASLMEKLPDDPQAHVGLILMVHEYTALRDAYLAEIGSTK